MARLQRKDVGAYSKRFVNSTVTLDLVTKPTVVSTHARFPGRSERLNFSTVTLFSSGKAVMVGASCWQEIASDIERVEEKFGKAQNINLRNVVGTANLGVRLDLPFLSTVLKCDYHPDIYHGMKVNLDNGSTCILFYSGKIISTGSASFEECEKSINNITALIKEWIL